MTSEENLRMFMQDYHRVLSTHRYGDLKEFFDFPVEFTLKGSKVTVKSISELSALFDIVRKRIVDRGVFKLAREVTFAHISDLRESLISTQEFAYDKDGNEIISWRKSYLLTRRNGLWRIARVNAINYYEVWEEAGFETIRPVSLSSLC